MQAARQAILHLVRRDPHYFGHDRSRWTLEMLLDSCHEVGWLAPLGSLPGLHQLLDRLGIGWKMGRQHVHSPDPQIPTTRLRCGTWHGS